MNVTESIHLEVQKLGKDGSMIYKRIEEFKSSNSAYFLKPELHWRKPKKDKYEVLFREQGVWIKVAYKIPGGRTIEISGEDQFRNRHKFVSDHIISTWAYRRSASPQLKNWIIGEISEKLKEHADLYAKNKQILIEELIKTKEFSDCAKAAEKEDFYLRNPKIREAEELASKLKNLDLYQEYMIEAVISVAYTLKHNEYLIETLQKFMKGHKKAVIDREFMELVRNVKSVKDVHEL
jgi:hypothetical protein